MAEYRLLIKPSAAKEIEAVDAKSVRQPIIAQIQALAQDAPAPTLHEQRTTSHEFVF